MALITPRKVMFSPDVIESIWTYIDKQIDYLSSQTQTFREVTLPEWTRLLKGTPKSETRDFPFPNASNLVVQLIATRVEQLLSRAMLPYQIDPLWVASALGDLPGQEADEQAAMIQQFMSDMAIDPRELNLFKKEEQFYHDGIAYGTSFMYLPHQYLTESEYVGIPGVTNGLARDEEFRTIVKKDGPSPENIPLQRILIDNRVTELGKARFVARQVPLSREAVEDRMAFGTWSRNAGEKILSSPDERGRYYNRIASDPKNIDSSGNEYDSEYMVYECFLKFTHDRKTYSMIGHYHKATKTRASLVFNYYPKNEIPLEDMRFGYDGDNYFGYGFIEMLKGYQEEVSQLHNNRLDNEAIRNNVALRIDKNSELASTLKFYPGVTIPADKDEVETLNLNTGTIDNGNSESIATGMANERAGIDPAITGNGSGIVNNKRGIYSSQGTMAVLQQQNNRTGLRMMDIRSAHVRIGRKLLDWYAFMGIGTRLARYGAQAPTLEKALASVKAGNLGLILKAASAGSNLDVDRQNAILLQGIQDKYIGTVNQMLQMIQQPQVSDEQKKYLEDVLFAQQALAKHIFRVFGHFDVDKLIPFPESIKNERFARQEQESNRTSQGAPQVMPLPQRTGGTTIPFRQAQ